MPSTDTNVTGFIGAPVEGFCATFYWRGDTGPTEWSERAHACTGNVPIDALKNRPVPKPHWWHGD